MQNTESGNPSPDRAESMDTAWRRQVEEIECAAAGTAPPKAGETTRRLAEMRGRARRLIYTGDEELAPAAPSRAVTDEEAAGVPGDLKRLPPRALHRLDVALAAVRHSAVESCFYNLQLYAGMLAGGGAPTDIEAKLTRALEGVEPAAARIEVFLSDRVLSLAPVQEVFPEEAARAREALASLREIKERMDQSIAHANRIDDATSRPIPLASDGRAIQARIEQTTGALARMQARVDDRRVELASLLCAAAEAERPRIEAAGIRLTTSLQRVADARLFLDPATLTDAVAETLRNAVRHGFGGKADADRKPAGEICLTADWADAGRRVARVTIADNGDGVAPADLPQLARRGFSTGGTGEGLALVRRVIEEEHLGRFHVESRPGEGTNVLFELSIKADLAMIEPKGV